MYSLDTGWYYKIMSPELAGTGMVADVFDGGSRDNIAFMGPIGGFTSQLWRFVSVGDGTYWLSTLSRGPAFSAEAIDRGPQGSLRLTRGASPAKEWRVEAVDGPGSTPAGSAPGFGATYVRLWTQRAGPDWSLALSEDENVLLPALSERSNAPGQAWLLARTEARAW